MNTVIYIGTRLNHLASILGAAILSIITTLLLVALMTYLVDTNFVAPPDKPDQDIPSVVWEEKKVTPLKRITKPVREKFLAEPPVIPNLKTQKQAAITLNPTVPVKPYTNSGMNMAFFSQDKPIATALVSPRYPSVAMRRGLEGFVDVQFDVLQDGTTHNLVVLSAQPEKVFNRAAISAVERWRFEPKRVEGKPVIYYAMVKRVRFNMEK